MRNKPVKAYTYYKVEGENVKRLKRICPKCGVAFLADHKDRLTCGNCGYFEKKNK
ncbi:MAG: 30S ribosomal protein S27ae [Candidatus Woesearchaeota archaeon]